VFGKGQLWQHSLSLTAQRGSAWAKEISHQRLPRGRYLAKIYIDQTGKLAQDPFAKLGETELVGEVEIQSQWPEGYHRMTVVPFPTPAAGPGLTP
jgi:hypothetical protein